MERVFLEFLLCENQPHSHGVYDSIADGLSPLSPDHQRQEHPQVFAMSGKVR